MSAFLIVNAKVPNELKKSFDKWYEEFHLPEAHKCFKSKIAFRGWIGENEHQAFYQFENLSTAKKLVFALFLTAFKSLSTKLFIEAK